MADNTDNTDNTDNADNKDGGRRVAVVTGGSGAIGGAIAARLAEDHTVVALDRDGDVAVDLADQAQVRQAAQEVLSRHGRVDVLVHAAAMVAFEAIEEFDLELWRQVQAVNVESALLLTQAFTPGMRQRRFGRLVFVVSNTFWRPAGGHQIAYVASKGALIGMARALAVGLGGDGVAAMAVAPGLTRTPATSVVPAEEFQDVAAHQALARPLTPDDAAAVVAMLVRDDAAALTGQTLMADGGLVLS
ncbi:NAD(P)-dependent dehydrogenase (short-subunit alcohol dehydrogenase family) [Catenulispora sp. MAP5-51]|uniref:SDR family NAD(P)-dependent oxidoreductase n=1 Tax=Catenulispora sp. MAP5-51 TaxID=3156298 RepID=UPI0035112CD6